MGFEEKLNYIYQNIATEVSSMIPDKWENIYLKAYVNDEGSEVFFFYRKPNEQALFYCGDIPEQYNVSNDIYMELLINVHKLFKKLRKEFIQYEQNPWSSCEFNFNNDGKLNVSFGYIDWKNSEFGQIARFNYYKYKKFGIIPELDYAKEEIKEIEQFIKEQEEE